MLNADEQVATYPDGTFAAVIVGVVNTVGGGGGGGGVEEGGGGELDDGRGGEGGEGGGWLSEGGGGGLGEGGGSGLGDDGVGGGCGGLGGGGDDGESTILITPPVPRQDIPPCTVRNTREHVLTPTVTQLVSDHRGLCNTHRRRH